MTARILQMPKSNQHLWDDLFNGFINQIDRAKAHFKVSSGAGAIKASVDSVGDAGQALGAGNEQTIVASPRGRTQSPVTILIKGSLARVSRVTDSCGTVEGHGERALGVRQQGKSLCAKQADGCATSRTAQDILASDSSYDPAPVGTQAPPAGITYHGNLARYVAENAVVPAKREQPELDLPDGYVSEDGGWVPREGGI